MEDGLEPPEMPENAPKCALWRKFVALAWRWDGCIVGRQIWWRPRAVGVAFCLGGMITELLP
jgi:hypothetical protein